MSNNKSLQARTRTQRTQRRDTTARSVARGQRLCGGGDGQCTRAQTHERERDRGRETRGGWRSKPFKLFFPGCWQAGRPLVGAGQTRHSNGGLTSQTGDSQKYKTATDTSSQGCITPHPGRSVKREGVSQPIRPPQRASGTATGRPSPKSHPLPTSPPRPCRLPGRPVPPQWRPC